VAVELEQLTRGRAAAIVAGDLSSLEAGEGWPHEDTLDGLRMAANPDTEPPWLVLLDGVVVGDCGTVGPPVDGGVEIGYGLAEPYRGRGLGTEVVGRLAELLLARPDVRRLTAEVLLDNVPSHRVLEKNGFVVEHTDGEHALYVRYPSSPA
jgi:RimJ/RimL family protein N-acetyltransferase